MLAPTRVKTIFRYPGSKSRKEILDIILGAFPPAFTEYREPFVGSGSVALCIDPSLRRWISDLDGRLMQVYFACVQRPEEFIRQLRAVPPAARDEEERFRELHDHAMENMVGWDIAINYYLLCRLSWGGRVTDSRIGTYLSDPTKFNIVHRPGVLEAFVERIKGCRMTIMDFEDLFLTPAWEKGGSVFVYADPPYVADTERHRSSQLYRKSFTMKDHERLADIASRSPHRVLISLDDHPRVRELYKNWAISAADWHYNLSRTEGRELLISNYPHTITDLRAHYADLGRRKSERKALAARENGKMAATPKARQKMREAWERRRAKP